MAGGDVTDRAGVPSVAASIAATFDAHSIAYVFVRGWRLFEREAVSELLLLVRAEDLSRAGEVLRSLGLSPHDVPGESGRSTWTTNGADRRPLHVQLTSVLSYGDRLRTGGVERHVLERRRSRDGIALASTSDELIDLVLYCVLEARSFEPEHRARVLQVMADLRAHPPEAGRAAIRVQTELAPVLAWSDLLADVLHERWDELLARRARLARHLRRRWPDRVMRGITGMLRRLRSR